jgi:hypothetical protein
MGEAPGDAGDDAAGDTAESGDDEAVEGEFKEV